MPLALYLVKGTLIYLPVAIMHVNQDSDAIQVQYTVLEVWYSVVTSNSCFCSCEPITSEVCKDKCYQHQ